MMKLMTPNLCLIIIISVGIAAISGCASNGSGSVSAHYYYGDPFYRYPYYRDDVIVRPPPRPKPEHPIHRPPRPTPLPSRPLPGPMPRMR